MIPFKNTSTIAGNLAQVAENGIATACGEWLECCERCPRVVVEILRLKGVPIEDGYVGKVVLDIRAEDVIRALVKIMEEDGVSWSEARPTAQELMDSIH